MDTTLEAVFYALRHQNLTTALQVGSRALVYCVQAGAHEQLSNFAGSLVSSTHDPRLLENLLPYLEAAAESAPEGQPRWRCLVMLGDALRLRGRPDSSLLFYEVAATQAHAVAEAGGDNAREAWADVAVTNANWGVALRMIGDLDAARQRQLVSAEASKKAGRSAVYVMNSELEALRIDIMRGRAAQSLPEVDVRLAQVEAWWQQHRVGQSVPEAPDVEMLVRVLISALHISEEAEINQGKWDAALCRVDAVIKVKQEVERPVESIAIDRLNRANVLRALRRFGEAKTELEDCLEIFQNDPASRANVLGSLADLFAVQGDVPQAITQQRRGLALCEALPAIGDRATSQDNLANYLERSGMASALAESRRHQLAALVYRLVSGLGQHLQTSLRNYAIDFRRAYAAGTELDVPRVAELLADPAFRPLYDWLRQRQADVGEVQAAVDGVLDQARQLALEQK